MKEKPKHAIGIEGRIRIACVGNEQKYRWTCSCGGRGQWWSTSTGPESAGKVHADYHNNKRRK